MNTLGVDLSVFPGQAAILLFVVFNMLVLIYFFMLRPHLAAGIFRAVIDVIRADLADDESFGLISPDAPGSVWLKDQLEGQVRRPGRPIAYEVLRPEENEMIAIRLIEGYVHKLVGARQDFMCTRYPMMTFPALRAGRHVDGRRPIIIDLAEDSNDSARIDLRAAERAEWAVGDLTSGSGNPDPSPNDDTKEIGRDVVDVRHDTPDSLGNCSAGQEPNDVAGSRTDADSAGSMGTSSRGASSDHDRVDTSGVSQRTADSGTVRPAAAASPSRPRAVASGPSSTPADRPGAGSSFGGTGSPSSAMSHARSVF